MANISELPSEAMTALMGVETWLLEQQFVDVNASGIRFHSSPDLVGKCQPLLDYLPDRCKADFDPNRHDTRVTAIHVHATMTIPVKDGSNSLLIPMCIGGGATLDGSELHSLQYAELKQGVVATPEFYALLLLSRTIA
ncbi:hypothetical protein NPX13_g27 [Xylaria arbuscula]|uniref:Uncharacterized protein n=1 Tax=Xylaria arbuscula TaxID=114810 RepID=A0A9W8NNK6_9PEZI|nr:hypothetical protein NPX13_g27 [Xylaria arbuscula]